QLLLAQVSSLAHVVPSSARSQVPSVQAFVTQPVSRAQLAPIAPRSHPFTVHRALKQSASTTHGPLALPIAHSSSTQLCVTHIVSSLQPVPASARPQVLSTVQRCVLQSTPRAHAWPRVLWAQVPSVQRPVVQSASC